MRSAGPSGLINTSHSDGSVSTCLQIKEVVVGDTWPESAVYLP